MLEPERILRLEADAVVLLDQRRLPLEEVEVACRVGGRGRGRDPDDGRPRRARDRGRGRVRARARGGARGGPRRGGRACCARRGRRRSTSPGRSTRCAAIRRPSTRARIHATRSSAAGGWPRTPPALLAPGTRALTHCNAGGLATGGYGSAVGALLAAWERGLLDARLGRRDAAAAPGRAPDRVGARDGGDPARGDRRLGRGVADGGRRGRLRDHRRRPDRRERRHREQDRHVLARGARAPPRAPAVRRRAELDRRPARPPTAPRSRSRSATPPR